MRGRLAVILLLVIAALLLAWWFVRDTPYPITNERPTGTTIVALGDSLTAGVGAASGRGYVDRLSAELGVPIVNAGVAGDTAGDALRRLDHDVIRHDPRIVIVCLGGNDLLRRVDRAETMGYLDEIVRRLQERGTLVVLVGLRPILGSSFAADVEALARRRGCPLVPDVLGGIMGDPDLMADQIHPNDAGYERFAEKVAAVVGEYVEPAETR